MTNQFENQFFILTGAMGSGKSTLLQKLRERGFLCIDEPARQILTEQRSIDGDGVPEKNSRLFTELMLSRAIFQFKEMQNHKGPVIFDRGIADNIAYASLFGFELQAAENAADKYRYNKQVFVTNGWEEIYRTDDERKMSFEDARKFGDEVKRIYSNLGYTLLELPLASPDIRAELIVKTLSENLLHDES